MEDTKAESSRLRAPPILEDDIDVSKPKPLVLARIPSVLPDAETSPIPSGSATPDIEANSGRPETPLALQRTSTTPSPYLALPRWQKWLMVFITSFTALSVTFASTSLFPLTQEISAELDTTATIIQVVNALVLFTMGCSGFLWGPIGKLVGRKNAWMAACAIFMLCTLGTGLAPGGVGRSGWKVFAAMRILSGVQGTYFHVAGQTWLAEIFEPTERGTANGFFLAGTALGPAFGPCVSGVVVTFTSWRVILWLQTAMMGTGLLLSIFFLPEFKRPNDPNQIKAKRGFVDVLKEFNPARIFRVMMFPNVILTDVACGLLSWSQYTLLAAPRHLLNPRFNLNTPLVSGLFYIAPGVGFLIGTIIGGKFSDMTVIKWIRIRGGLRLPQDRLNSGMISFFFVIPVSSLIYGWGLHYEVGGMALPIITAFFTAFGLLLAFASLNTYCAEVLPKQRTEVIGSKYFVQLTWASAASASIVPLIDAIGIGPAASIGVAFVLLAGVLTFITAKYGMRMQNRFERRRAVSVQEMA